MNVHGGIYLLDPYDPVNQPLITRDRLIQRGEVVSLWDAHPEETLERWGMAPIERPHWHITNPTVLRFVIEGVTKAQVEWITAKWVIPTETSGDRVIAARLWQFDIDQIVQEIESTLGRPIDSSTDVVIVDPDRRNRWVKRRAEDGSGMMFNKAYGDIPLNNPALVEV